MELQIETLCRQLQQHNQENLNIESKAARNAALLSIQNSIQLLQQHPATFRKRSIPPVRTLSMILRTGWSILSVVCSIIILHFVIILYFGLIPHTTVYTCSSLVTHNYAQFDFISPPSVMKMVACLGLTYKTLQRNQGVVMGIHHIQNGTLSIRAASSMIYRDTKTTVYEIYEGKRNLTNTQLYQDVIVVEGYIQWTIESIWYIFTHSAADSTRTFIKWLNKKTQIIVALRDAFIELPVIRHVRNAVKAVEHTVEHHVIRPIREKIREGVQCLIDGVSYFGKRLIQWGKTTQLGRETMKLETNRSV